MNSKRTKMDYVDSKIPQSALEALFYFFWPLNSWLKKSIVVVFIVLVASFTVWLSLPEKTKTEAINYLKGNTKAQTPEIVTPRKAPSANGMNDVRQHTEGDQSPAVISNGDVNINIRNKDSEK
jgi:hypothetical protein